MHTRKLASRETVEGSHSINRLIPFLNGGSRPGHKVSGTRSKLPNLNENGQKPHFSLGLSDSEPGQNFV